MPLGAREEHSEGVQGHRDRPPTLGVGLFSTWGNNYGAPKLELGLPGIRVTLATHRCHKLVQRHLHRLQGSQPATGALVPILGVLQCPNAKHGC